MSKRSAFFKDYIMKQSENTTSDTEYDPSTSKYDSDSDPGWEPEPKVHTFIKTWKDFLEYLYKIWSIYISFKKSTDVLRVVIE